MCVCVCVCVCMHALVVRLCQTLWDSMDYNPLGSSVQGISQSRIVEWVAIPFSRGSSQPRDWTWVSCIAGGFFTVWGIRKAQGTNPRANYKKARRARKPSGDGETSQRLAMTTLRWVGGKIRRWQLLPRCWEAGSQGCAGMGCLVRQMLPDSQA